MSFPGGTRLRCDDFLCLDFDKRSRRKGGWMSLSHIKHGLGMETRKGKGGGCGEVLGAQPDW
jgi:hypothetical protein